MLIFLTGTIGYAFVEILFRGYTHWSMMLTGGACVLAIYYLNRELRSAPLMLRALAGTFIILLFEFAVGLVVNIWFGWGIWDYSDVPGNILGQICPAFAGAWFALSLGLCTLTQKLTCRSSND